jgi:hypothetical protein
MHQPHMRFNPSLKFILIITTILLATLITIIFLSCAFWLKLILIASLFPYGEYILCHYGLLQKPDSIIGVTVTEEGWKLHTKNKVFPAILSGDSTVTRHVSILRFQIPSQRWKKSFLIFKDSFADKEGYRRFCLQLRSTLSKS